MIKLLEIIKNSLEKKQTVFNKKLSNHINNIKNTQTENNRIWAVLNKKDKKPNYRHNVRDSNGRFMKNVVNYSSDTYQTHQSTINIAIDLQKSEINT